MDYDVQQQTPGIDCAAGNFSARATLGHYHDVATRYGAPSSTFNGSAVVGYSSDEGGNLSLSYLSFFTLTKTLSVMPTPAVSNPSRTMFT